MGGKKMKKHNKKYGKLVVFALFFILISMSAAQALVQFNIIDTKEPVTSDKMKVIDDPLTQPLLDDPFFTWEDDFESLEWVDPDPVLSYDFELVDGAIQMKNTYSIWTDPAWTRMKPIEITNNAGQPLSNYAVQLTIDYDPDMQSDYDDIRFRHEDSPTTWLDYWIETEDSSSATVWVEVPVIPTEISMMYLFYGNPIATSLSDFYSVFSDWEEEWANDERITYHLNSEGAWDPDVCYGNNRFLVAWEEGQAPYIPYTYFFKQEIRASIFDTDGTIIVADFRIYNPGGIQYRDEDPSIAFGGSNFFVAWEHYNTPTDKTTMDIKGRTVTTSGGTGSVINICSQSNRQADPNVEFDSVNNRFCVVWEDARNGMNNYNIYGRLYDTSGSPVGSEKIICSAANNQFEPWIAFDTINEQYMIVWEEGLDPDVGPFSLKAGLFDEDLNQVGSTITIATGTSNTDYIFPCVAFCEETERFLITYNDGDLSQTPKDYWGDAWGIILDTSGNTVVSTFQIRSGNFVRTDIVPYLSSSFFVSFDDDGTVWGKLVSSEGDVFVGDVQLSASTSAVADWANMAVGDGKIFVTWEDTRVIYPYPWNGMPDAFGNIWNLNIPSGSDVTYDIGTEKKLILTAQITSKPIEPDNLLSWYEFGVTSSGAIVFNVLDGTATTIILAEVTDGEDLSNINPETYQEICLQAYFSRSNPSSSPLLDLWRVVYIGLDEDPPETTISIESGILGQNGWYIGNVKCELSATDGQQGSGVNHTYFQIDDGDIQEYDDAVGIKIPLHATGDPNTAFGEWDIYYWSVDKSGNVESKQGPLAIKIDKVPPYCEIWDPPDRGSVPRQGGFWVQATTTDVGSGINYVAFDVGPPYENPVKIYDVDPPGSDNYKWWCDRSVENNEWRHIIAQAFDYAGHMYEANIYVYFPYIYIVKINSNLLQNLVQYQTYTQTQVVVTGVTTLPLSR